jgi:hypothetical protein
VENVGVTITSTETTLLYPMAAQWPATVPPPPSTPSISQLIPGNRAELCGGSWRLTMFTNSGYAPVTFTTTTVTGWTYLGCYTDALDTRALTANIYFDNAMTVNKCLAYCKSKGDTTAAVEYGTQCYCGTQMAAWSVASGSLDPVVYGCNMPCGGMDF